MNDKKTSEFSTRNLIFALFIVWVLAIILEAGISFFVLKNDLKKSSEMFLNQLEIIIENNKKSEEIQLEELKDTYITSAKATAYLIAEDPEIVNDVGELRKVAALFNLDEIHIFDENGTITNGTNPEYWGLNMNDGDQVAFFLPMLEDKSLSMCQDVTPNTAVSKQMMYAITWSDDGKYMVQVGVEPLRLLDMFKDHRIENVIGNIPLPEGYEIYVVDCETRVVMASTNPVFVGTGMSEVFPSGSKSDGMAEGNLFVRHHENLYYCSYKSLDEYIIAVAYMTESGNSNFYVPLIIIAVYLFITGAVILLLFLRLKKADEKKHQEMEKYIEEATELNASLKEKAGMISEQNRMLKSLADIYYSMHLIDLDNNTLEEFAARGAVEEITNSDMNAGADDIMQRVMHATIVDEYLEKALEFTDLKTISYRMANKKLVTREFRGKNIGWFLALFITVETNAFNRPTKVIFATRSIDEDKKKEESLIHRSNTDELTGAYNRRAYEDEIRELNFRGAKDSSVYIAFDVNGLKTVNDSIGHEAGDELIVGASDCIKRAVSPYGSMYRTGGDEFVALINADQEELEKVINSLDENMTLWRGKLVDSLSVSYGVVTKNEMPDASLHEISVLADKRMYESKTVHYRKSGVDRRVQNDAFTALCNQYTKILKISLDEDSYQIISMNESELSEDMGFSDKISEWLISFAKSGQVHPDDVSEYLQKTDINYIKDYFKNENATLHVFYRRKYGDEFKRVMMEIVPANDYGEDNHKLFLYVKNIDK